jgi:hypothetical protein
MPNKRGRTAAKAERPLSCSLVSALKRANEDVSDIGSSAIAVVIVYLAADDHRWNNPYCERVLKRHRKFKFGLPFLRSKAFDSSHP